MKEKLLEGLLRLAEQSVLVSGTISVVLVTACAYMWVNEIPVPPELLMALSTVIAFFFGARTERNARMRYS